MQTSHTHTHTHTHGNVPFFCSRSSIQPLQPRLHGSHTYMHGQQQPVLSAFSSLWALKTASRTYSGIRHSLWNMQAHNHAGVLISGDVESSIPALDMSFCYYSLHAQKCHFARANWAWRWEKNKDTQPPANFVSPLISSDNVKPTL
jgi:hypothetical protein